MHGVDSVQWDNLLCMYLANREQDIMLAQINSPLDLEL